MDGGDRHVGQLFAGGAKLIAHTARGARLMESIYLLIPISVILVFGIAVAFWWSVRSGQFDDLEGPGFRVLMDEDQPKLPTESSEIDKSEKI
jgi:cbb3-type cytochrome oxidase maturation protein